MRGHATWQGMPHGTARHATALHGTLACDISWRDRLRSRALKCGSAPDGCTMPDHCRVLKGTRGTRGHSRGLKSTRGYSRVLKKRQFRTKTRLTAAVMVGCDVAATNPWTRELCTPEGQWHARTYARSNTHDAHLQARTHARTHARKHTHAHACTRPPLARTHACTHTRTHVSTHMYMHAHARTRPPLARTHARTHASARAHMHMHMHARAILLCFALR